MILVSDCVYCRMTDLFGCGVWSIAFIALIEPYEMELFSDTSSMAK